MTDSETPQHPQEDDERFVTYEEYKEKRSEELYQKIVKSHDEGAIPTEQVSRTIKAVVESLFQVQEEADSRRFRDLQCNYSALMYLLTEQQALIGKLLEEMLRAGLINEALLEKVTAVYGNGEILDPLYSELHRRFIDYFLRTWKALETGEATTADVFPERNDSDEPKTVLPK